MGELGIDTSQAPKALQHCPLDSEVLSSLKMGVDGIANSVQLLVGYQMPYVIKYTSCFSLDGGHQPAS